MILSRRPRAFSRGSTAASPPTGASSPGLIPAPTTAPGLAAGTGPLRNGPRLAAPGGGLRDNSGEGGASSVLSPPEQPASRSAPVKRDKTNLRTTSGVKHIHRVPIGARQPSHRRIGS